MNGQPTVNHSATNNEQLIGKFHVVNIDKPHTNQIVNHDEATIAGQQQQQPPPPSSVTSTDESIYPSRFQMIRVDRNFVRGRWKVNDYEPPENMAAATNPPVNNTVENEPINISNIPTSSTVPTTLATAPTITTIPSNVPLVPQTDPNAALIAALAATNASSTAAFQQQQQRLAMNNPATIVPAANVPPPAGLLPGYPPTAMSNMGGPNQPYILPGHPQFGYYQFFLPPYSPYAAQWAALAAATNSYLPAPIPQPQQQAPQIPTGNLGDPMRLADTAPDGTSENPVISCNPFPNLTADYLQNAQLGAPPGSFMYAGQHPHSTYLSQVPPNNSSSYTTIAPYPQPGQPGTIIPSPARPNSLAQTILNNMTELQQQQQQQQVQSYPGQPQTQQSAPILTSPKQDASSTKNLVQPSMVPKVTTANTTAPAKPLTTVANTTNPDLSKTTAAQINQTRPITIPGQNVTNDTLRATNSTYVTDLLSASPAFINAQQSSHSLMSPITIQAANPNNLLSPNKATTASLNDILALTGAGAQLNLSQTTDTAAAAMYTLNSENSQNTEITNKILKELTTPTKQNNFSVTERRGRYRNRRKYSSTDIDNKISAAMDLVKMHLLSAVREEVTELRQQIKTLTEKATAYEQENTFLRQHVPSEICAQYVPLHVGSSSASDSSNPTTTVASSVPLSSTITPSQPIPTAAVSSLPSALGQQPTLSTTSQPLAPPPPSSSNLSST
ncbi:unnamed protein product [Rotaria socialis]|uniref:Uncharacterized protein n=2 Tax=Rotaria socialis TaxID=392032 RepID=A0A817V2I9_9BILA|nr:unnamed protein product [Rotaria socialis]